VHQFVGVTHTSVCFMCAQHVYEGFRFLNDHVVRQAVVSGLTARLNSTAEETLLTPIPAALYRGARFYPRPDSRSVASTVAFFTDSEQEAGNIYARHPPNAVYKLEMAAGDCVIDLTNDRVIAEVLACFKQGMPQVPGPLAAVSEFVRKAVSKEICGEKASELDLFALFVADLPAPVKGFKRRTFSSRANENVVEYCIYRQWIDDEVL
jgi:hypothetical protein